MNFTPAEPSEEVLETFRIRVLTPLGGRLNQHWLVASPREQLVLRRCYQPSDSIDYEIRLLAHLAKLGWPVPYVVADPTTIDGHTWTLAPFLPGEPATDDPNTEGRERGRLSAHLHQDLAQFQTFGQRARWRRGEDILADITLDPYTRRTELRKCMSCAGTSSWPEEWSLVFPSASGLVSSFTVTSPGGTSASRRVVSREFSTSSWLIGITVWQTSHSPGAANMMKSFEGMTK